MRIPIDEITAAPKALDYDEDVEELNARLTSGPHDYRIPHALAVSVRYYRAGVDIFFQGAVKTTVEGTCARCAETYVFGLDAPMTVVLTPRSADPATTAELSAEDLSFGFYEGKEVDLTPLVYEHALLALPTRPLCRDECRGLCPRCGVNLNDVACECTPAAFAPRLAGLDVLVRGKTRIERSR